MCTVTFIPTAEGIHLTSNRDESSTRSRALPPQKYVMGNDTIIFPKDQDSGGSWIAVKNNGDAAVLLNGAFIKHTSLSFYKKSRGLIFLEIISSPSPLACFSKTDLNAIEPFTLILFINNTLHECRWDSKIKHAIQLSTTMPQIWSSVTLYDTSVKQNREQWFKEWMLVATEFSTESILHFHKFAGTGDTSNDLLMNREDKISTVSITSVLLAPKKSEVTYVDLKGQVSSTVSLTAARSAPENTSPAANLKLRVKRAWIKISNWEYWPFAVVYLPILPYWLWLSLKARSFFFFSAANTSIQNSGFVHERKSLIYDLMPQEYYPKTLFCEKDITEQELDALLTKQGFDFPLIAKPDIGEKGIQVKLLQRKEELTAYMREKKVDFLIQEFISYEKEVGIFYYRIPGEPNGHISGVVGKEFLAVLGDGQSTIEQLLMKEDRFMLQLPVLKITYGQSLQQILPEGSVYTLVPYGNHCRGAKFIDLSYKINETLTQVIDSVCKKIPGFYFGRLDIKFNNWDDLYAGKKFSIIELNGAGSEPTHMYDPSHSLFFAWREIIRHWRLLYTISRLNAKKKGMPLMGTAAGMKMMKEHSQYLKLIS